MSQNLNGNFLHADLSSVKLDEHLEVLVTDTSENMDTHHQANETAARESHSEALRYIRNHGIYF
jgi:hypothetical protein